MNGGTIEMRSAGIERASEKMKQDALVLERLRLGDGLLVDRTGLAGDAVGLDDGVVAGALDGA